MDEISHYWEISHRLRTPVLVTIQNWPAKNETLVIETRNSFKTLSSLPLLKKLSYTLPENNDYCYDKKTIYDDW